MPGGTPCHFQASSGVAGPMRARIPSSVGPRCAGPGPARSPVALDVVALVRTLAGGGRVRRRRCARTESASAPWASAGCPGRQARRRSAATRDRPPPWGRRTDRRRLRRRRPSHPRRRRPAPAQAATPPTPPAAAVCAISRASPSAPNPSCSAWPAAVRGSLVIAAVPRSRSPSRCATAPASTAGIMRRMAKGTNVAMTRSAPPASTDEKPDPWVPVPGRARGDGARRQAERRHDHELGEDRAQPASRPAAGTSATPRATPAWPAPAAGTAPPRRRPPPG